jgi:hypothetical protein
MVADEGSFYSYIRSEHVVSYVAALLIGLPFIPYLVKSCKNIRIGAAPAGLRLQSLDWERLP